MSPEELKDLLYDAQEKLFEAIELIEVYVKETDNRNAKAYLLDHLKIMASSNHGYLTRDISIDDLINRIDEREDN